MAHRFPRMLIRCQSGILFSAIFSVCGARFVSAYDTLDRFIHFNVAGSGFLYSQSASKSLCYSVNDVRRLSSKVNKVPVRLSVRFFTSALRFAVLIAQHRPFMRDQNIYADIGTNRYETYELF